MEYRINLDVFVDEEFLTDVMTCALEGGVGYWLMCDAVVRDEELRVTEVFGLYDAETEDEFPQQYLGISDIVRGLELITSPNSGIVSERFRKHVTKAILEEDGICSLDASDCDVIVQVALFGKVVYG